LLPFWTAKRIRFAASDILIDCPFGFPDTRRKSKVQGFWLISAKTLHLNKIKTALKD